MNIKLESELHFTVLCVTLRTSSNSRDPIWHRCVTGGSAKAKLVTRTTVEYGIPVVQTLVVFQDKEYELAYLRPGLDGNAVTVAIKMPNNPTFDIKELYTDIPTPYYHYSPLGESLDGMARKAMERSS